MLEFPFELDLELELLELFFFELELADSFWELLFSFLESPVNALATLPMILPRLELRPELFFTFFVSLLAGFLSRSASLFLDL